MSIAHAFRLLLEISAWAVAVLWAAKVVSAAFGFRRLPNLLDSIWDCEPKGMPGLTVIVPARDEAADIGTTIRSLLAQDYPYLDIIAVDDRSNDQTGPILELIAAKHPEKLRVVTITELPAGWLGKTHAMAVAARKTTSEWILFTDADVNFAPDALRRSLVLAQEMQADHVITMPTMEVRRWDEGMMLGFFQVFGLWVARPWQVSNSRARRDAVGVGAFNMIRRTAYEQIGGFEAQPMTVLEDVLLGRRVKAAGLAQRLAFGRGLVQLHWAKGAPGMVRAMTKNLFSGFAFSVPLLLGACSWILAFCILPVLGLATPGLRLPAAVTLLAIAGAYWLCAPRSGISAWYMVLFPSGAFIFVIAMLHSMMSVRRNGGVMWRGTFYPLEELRRYENSIY